MKRSQFLAAALSVILSPAAPTLRTERMHIFQRENVLGTSFELKVLASSAAAAFESESAALAEITRENAILSSWSPDSEFSRWFHTRGQAVPVSPELFEVLSTFDTWRALTKGALDAAAEAVTRAERRRAARAHAHP